MTYLGAAEVHMALAQVSSQQGRKQKHGHQSIHFPDIWLVERTFRTEVLVTYYGISEAEIMRIKNSDH